MDYFHQFGLAISGLANPGDEATRLPEPEEDKKPSIVPGQIPDEEKTSQFIKAKENFMKYIMASLERNAQIPKSSHCPVPEMKVNLPIPEGTVLYRRLHPYAEKQNSILDEAIQQWLKDDVITLAPAGNVHNNTLTLVVKKDKKGEKTLWRVCLDPRPLNKLLPDDNFPLLLVADIIAKLAGHAIFTTLDLLQVYHRLPINKDDQKLTAFMHNGKQYMFKKAPFGLKPLSSLF